MPDQPQYRGSERPAAVSAVEHETIERELVPLARSAALGDLAGDIAHDMANPLFAVIGLVDLLLLDAEPGSRLADRLGLVKHTALELKDSLRAVLDFARPPEGHESAALDDAVRAAVALVRRGHAKELTVAATYAASPVVVRCPSGALAQAALHLVAAGRAAAGDAGTVEVEVEVAEEGMLRVRPCAEAGLGLVAARLIAADHGGTLTRDGDAVTLRLPLWIAS